MVSQAGKEYSSAEKGYLKCLYVDIYTMAVPCVCPQRIRDGGGEQPVEVEEEEDGEDSR